MRLVLNEPRFFAPDTGQGIGSGLPTYRAEDLCAGGAEARILLGDQFYTLRITKAGKLILTKQRCSDHSFSRQMARPKEINRP